MIRFLQKLFSLQAGKIIKGFFRVRFPWKVIIFLIHIFIFGFFPSILSSFQNLQICMACIFIVGSFISIEYFSKVLIIFPIEFRLSIACMIIFWTSENFCRQDVVAVILHCSWQLIFSRGQVILSKKYLKYFADPLKRFNPYFAAVYNPCGVPLVP